MCQKQSLARISMWVHVESLAVGGGGVVGNRRVKLLEFISPRVARCELLASIDTDIAVRAAALAEINSFLASQRSLSMKCTISLFVCFLRGALTKSSTRVIASTICVVTLAGLQTDSAAACAEDADLRWRLWQ